MTNQTTMKAHEIPLTTKPSLPSRNGPYVVMFLRPVRRFGKIAATKEDVDIWMYDPMKALNYGLLSAPVIIEQ